MRLLRLCAFLLLLGTVGRAVSATVPELEAAVAANPDSLKARFVLGKAYSAAGDSARAIATYNEILSRRRAASVMFQLGLEYSKTNQLEQAILLWHEILTTDNPQTISKPLSTMTMEYLGMALHKQGNYDQALGWWRRFLEVEPTAEKARLFAGVEQYKLGKFREAARDWLLLLKSRPSAEIAKRCLYYLGMAFVKLADPAKAAKVFERLLTVDPQHAGARKALAKLKAHETPPVPPPTEVTKQDDDAASRGSKVDPPANPQYQLPPTTADAPIPPPPGHVGEPEKMSLQAEELFLDGLDQKEKGNYEKALFAFLQALDVDPKFTQVYLQVGEVYLQLARLAPNPAQFGERLTLALQSLGKVASLAPNTLLAHSAQGKIVQATKIEKAGFVKYHEDIAAAAFKDSRDQDAFEEYILLLSNKHLKDEIFLNLATMLGKLNRGNRQDLQFFLEDLSSKNVDHPFVPYLLGMTYLCVDKQAEARIALTTFLEKMSHLDLKEAPMEAFKSHAAVSKADPNAIFLWGSVLFAKNGPDWRKVMQEYLKKSRPTALFRGEAVKKLATVERRPATEAMDWRKETEQFLTRVPAASVLFEPFVEKAHADAKLQEECGKFTTSQPENGVARLALAWIESVRAERSGSSSKHSDELLAVLLKERPRDPEWHFRAGVMCLAWGMEERGRAFLKTSSDILLVTGQQTSAPFAAATLEAAHQMIQRGSVSGGGTLLRQALIYDSGCLGYYLVRYELDAAQGRYMAALWDLVDWARKSLAIPWYRMIILTNCGLLAVSVLMLAVLGAALALTLRYMESLIHFISEYMQAKGTLLSMPLAMLFMLIFLPTGFIVVFPLVSFGLLAATERHTYLGLILVLLVLPLCLPISFENNFDTIRMAQEVRDGNGEAARQFFADRIHRSEGDYVARFMLGLINLRAMRLDDAEYHFGKLFEQRPHDVGVLVNLGVVRARRLDYRKATSLFTQALSKETANLQALYNLKVVWTALNNQEKAQQYLKWANTAALDPDIVQRYEAFTSEGPQQLYMDHPLDPAELSGLFSFFSTQNFFALNAPVLKVLMWLLAGGGLLAWLILSWQRLDFILTRCTLCHRVICNHCLRGQGSRSLCDGCSAGPKLDKDKEKTAAGAAAHKVKEWQRRKAFFVNLLLPGSGLYLANLAPVGAFLQIVYLAFLMTWLQNGGVLLHRVFHVPDLPVVRLLLWLCLVMAMGVYFLSQVAMYQVRNDVDAV